MSNTQKSFLKGAALLAICGLICKIIGAVFRIPLANVLGEVGMGNYQLAYPIYALLLVVSTAGLPTAISKLVSERVTLGDYAGAHYIFRVARLLLLLIGLVSAAVMILFNSQIAAALARPSAAIVLTAIAPALFFVAILSAYRGYYQGMQQMAPTAFTQLIEQLGKLGFGLWLASLWLPMGPEYGAAGALLGVTLSEICALAGIMGYFARCKKKIMERVRSSEPAEGRYTVKKTVASILKLAIPITLGACIMPFVSAIDSAVVIRSLTATGFDGDTATALFGLLTGYVNPLINMPAVLSLAFAMSLVPAISSSRAAGDLKGVADKSSLGFRLAVLVGMPCAMGFFLLSGPILKLLYSSLATQSFTTTVVLLEIMSLAVLFLTVVQTTAGVLQGLGRVFTPVINLLIGAVVKVVVSITLIQIPEINILGAAIGTLCCYAVAATLDVIMCVRYTHFKFSILNHLLRPLLATGVMGVVTYFSYAALSARSNTIATLVSIILSVVVYCIALVLFRAIREEDMRYIPGGAKLTRLLKKVKLWK